MSATWDLGLQRAGYMCGLQRGVECAWDACSVWVSVVWASLLADLWVVCMMSVHALLCVQLVWLGLGAYAVVYLLHWLLRLIAVVYRVHECIGSIACIGSPSSS